MGLFDYVRSDYPLGPDFTGECQTKDMDRFGGSMSHFYIDPSGCVWWVDLRGTSDFVELKEGDEGYNEKLPILNLKLVPNGTHGKVSPYVITDYVTIYPSRWDGKWEDWPEARLHIVNGEVKSFTTNIKGERLNVG